MEDVALKQGIQILVLQHCILNAEDFHTLLQRVHLVHPAKHIYEAILFVLLKEEVEVHSQPVHVLVVIEDLKEEALLVLSEESE